MSISLFLSSAFWSNWLLTSVCENYRLFLSNIIFRIVKQEKLYMMQHITGIRNQLFF
jgi:hypothetical protein